MKNLKPGYLTTEGILSFIVSIGALLGLVFPQRAGDYANAASLLCAVVAVAVPIAYTLGRSWLKAQAILADGVITLPEVSEMLENEDLQILAEKALLVLREIKTGSYSQR